MDFGESTTRSINSMEFGKVTTWSKSRLITIGVLETGTQQLVCFVIWDGTVSTFRKTICDYTGAGSTCLNIIFIWLFFTCDCCHKTKAYYQQDQWKQTLWSMAFMLCFSIEDQCWCNVIGMSVCSGYIDTFIGLKH